MSAAEVATIVGCSTEAVYKRLQRGHLHLVRALSPGVSRRCPQSFILRDCRRAHKLLPAYLDGAVSAEERAWLEAHVARCPRCPPLVQAISALIGRMADTDDAHEEVDQKVLARIRETIRGEIGP